MQTHTDKCHQKSKKLKSVSKKERIIHLYHRLKANSISKSELDEFLGLLSEDKGQENLDMEFKDTWEHYKTQSNTRELKDQIEELKSKFSEKRISKERKVFRMYRIAASLAILIAFTAILFSTFPKNIEYSTGFGEREKINLPDGSVVELNANSTLVWNKDWEKNGVRKVRLKGEAFFEVRHLDQDQKFIVSTSDVDVNVLGTSFNVSKRGEKTEVYLSEGSVKLGLKGKTEKELMMVPGQKISYSKEKGSTLENRYQKLEIAASWKNDVLYFDDKTVEEILKEVSEIYGMEFYYHSQDIKHRKLNFWVPYKDWSTTREAFELTMNLRIEEQSTGKYLVSGKN